MVDKSSHFRPAGPILLMMLLACSLPESNGNSSPTRNISVAWEVIDNLQDGGRSFLSELTLTNNGPGVLENRHWTLYFNFIRPIFIESAPKTIRVTHINGDFYKLEPTDLFSPLARGDS